MKTNEELKEFSYIPNGLKEVWEWKDKIYQETKNMSSEEFLQFIHQSVKEMLDEYNYEEVLDPDGAWRIHRK